MSQEFSCPPLDAILDGHRRLIELYGGAPGIRDPGGIEASLARVQQIAAYTEGHQTIFDMAAAIGFGMTRIHHPFVDGNKCVAFYATFSTLWMNGWRLDVAERDAAEMMEQVAMGGVEEQAFVSWLRSNCLAREQR